VGPGVTSVKKRDHVIPLYTPECRQCKSCLSRKTNLWTAIRATQGKGLMPDSTSRFSIGGRPIHHYMGCSTFATTPCCRRSPWRRSGKTRPLRRSARSAGDDRHWCGDQYGPGGARRQCRGIRVGRHRAERAAGRASADKIVGVKINPAREALARKFGMTRGESIRSVVVF